MRLGIKFNTIGVYGLFPKDDTTAIIGYLSQLLAKKFDSAFDVMSLDLSFPPMYIARGNKAEEEKFYNHYKTLPVFRLERQKKQISVILKAPEFSEHLQAKESLSHKYKLDIEDKYKGIAPIQLAHVLLDKCIDAAKLIEPNLCEEDNFDVNKFIKIVEKARENIKPEFLAEIRNKQDDELRLARIKYAKELRKERKENRKPLTKPVQDVRVYGEQDILDHLKSFAHYYSIIFDSKLRQNGLMCPEYDRLYIRVGKTKDDALVNSVSFEPSHVYGIATIDLDRYLEADDEVKQGMVFNLIADGLRDIAKIDGLDKKVLEDTIKEIEGEGLNTELFYKETENSKYHLELSYQVKPTAKGKAAPLYFTITNKWTNKKSKQFIAYFDSTHMEELYLMFDKITINNKEVRVEASDSIAARIHLRGKPREMIFDIENLL